MTDKTEAEGARGRQDDRATVWSVSERVSCVCVHVRVCIMWYIRLSMCQVKQRKQSNEPKPSTSSGKGRQSSAKQGCKRDRTRGRAGGSVAERERYEKETVALRENQAKQQ